MRLNSSSSIAATLRLLLACSLIALATRPLSAGVLGAWAPLFTRISQPVVLPVQMANGAMLVEARINGQGPFNLIVDTGCTASIISPAVAAAVDARTPETDTYIPAINSLGGTGAVPYVLLDSLALGGARFEGVPAGVTSLDLQSKITGLRIDGLLGYSVFSDIFLTLDFPRHRIVLSSAFPSDLPPVRSELAIEEVGSVPFITLNLQNRDLSVMLDSGANGSLELNVDEAAGLDWKIAPRTAGLVAALGGLGRDTVGRLSGTARLGTITQEDPVTALGAGVSRLGTDFFRTLCVVFNRERDRLWICADSTAPIPSPAKRSVGLSLLADREGWRVAGIIPGSPAAAAEVAPDDMITEIQDTPASRWSREEIQQLINRSSALSVAISGPSGARRLELPVWSLVP